MCRLNRETQKLDKLSVFQSDYGSSPRHACFVKNTPYVLIQNEYDGHLCSYRLDRSAGTLERISRVDIMDPSVKGSAFSLAGRGPAPLGH